MAFITRSCCYCGKMFKADTREVNRGNAKFCSLGCSSAYGNKLRKKPKIPNHKCDYCGKKLYRKPSSIRSKGIYCSTNCFYKATHPLYTKEQLLQAIQNFYLDHGRIPTYKEFEIATNYPNPANYQNHFGSWNKAIIKAGFKPNSSIGYVAEAKDGHICYSFAELTIDNFLFEQGIEHLKEVKYPFSNKRADWLVGNTYIEYFGLDIIRNNSIATKYKAIIKDKRAHCQEYNLRLIEIYPEDINNLESLLYKFEPQSKTNGRSVKMKFLKTTILAINY